MIYLYDGSFEGLLTCIFEAFLKKPDEVSIRVKESYQPSFLDEAAFIETDMEKFHRVYSSIPKKISKQAAEIVYRVWLSEDEKAADLIYHFLRIGYKMGGRVCDYIQDSYINEIIGLNRKVGFEVHRFLGLLRFQEVIKGVFYAGYEPDHNITALIAPHFTERLASQPFIIHDKKRNICAVYDGQEVIMTDTIPKLPLTTTDNEEDIASLWRTFFKTIAIKERKNPRTQANFMPKRYWRNLTEMNESPD
jgi:probable DNA metabolism protein